MSGLGIVGCGALGVVMGVIGWVLVERVPDRRPVLEGPFPEIVGGFRHRLGLAVIALTGVLCAAVAASLGDVWGLPAFLVLTATLVTLSAIDLRHYILPNRIVLPLTIVTLVLFGAATIANDNTDQLLRALACGAGAFLAFLVLHVASPRAMGFGDVKLSFVLGVALGWLGLFLGFVYGAVVGVVLIATKVRSRNQHVPFGPFLAAGAITAILIGDAIVDWYRR
jgi:leader peptidase (prepilin peptidase) / N-methyltransferase